MDGMRNLRECLGEQDSVLLRAIAERLDVTLASDHQPAMADAIAAALLDKPFLIKTLDWLSKEERQALDTLIVNGGRMRLHRFAQRFGKIRRYGPGSMAREAPWRAPINAAETLWYLGLISRSFVEEGGTAVELVFIPADLLPLLPLPSADRQPFVVPVGDDPDSVSLGGTALIDDLCTLLILVQSRTVRPREGALPPEDIQELEAQLLDKDMQRFAFLYHLAQAVSLLTMEGRVLRVARERAREWLKLSRPEQIFGLQEAWSKDPEWNDLRHVPGIRCEDTGWRNDPLVARRTVLDLLARSRSDAWLSIEGFVSAVHEQAPDYARPDGDFESWYIRDARSGEYLTGFKNWDRVEGALLLYLLSGPLHWLGIVSLGYREGWNKPSVFRLTPWGSAFLGVSDASLEELPPQPARISPDGVITLGREASLRDRYQLGRIADWRASGPEYVYAITPASLGRALANDIKVEMVERFLDRISAGGVPEEALSRIQTWAGHYGQVSLRRATILETRTSQLMTELRAHERVRGYLRELLSPTIALVRGTDWALLIAELHAAGYLPKIIER